MSELAIDQQRKPVGMSECGGFVGSVELGKRLGHAGQGFIYMLNGDNGGSNTDPWATKSEPSNHWVKTALT